MVVTLSLSLNAAVSLPIPTLRSHLYCPLSHLTFTLLLCLSPPPPSLPLLLLSLPLPFSQVCSRCGSGDRTVTIMTSLASRLDNCQACGVVLCGTCSRKSFFPLPPGIRHSVGLFICLSVCISFCRSVRLCLPLSIYKPIHSFICFFTTTVFFPNSSHLYNSYFPLIAPICPSLTPFRSSPS
jgi:hypothetical protein